MPKLLAFFIEVAALEAQRLRGVGHVMLVALEFGKERFALEGFDSLGQAVQPEAADSSSVACSANAPACGRARAIAAASTASPVASSKTRSMTLRNSRTFPGHE